MLSRWKPSVAIKLSILLHIGAAVAWGMGVSWTLMVGLLVANHVVLTVAGLWPRSTLLGANMLSLPLTQNDSQSVAITIDDGPDPDTTPLVLDILDKYHAKASFFCIGKAIEAQPKLALEIVNRGHRIENHSYSHRHYFSMMGLSALRNEILKAQEAIFNITGYQPKYFRAPAGLRNPLLDPMLQSLSLKLVSWTRRGFDTQVNDPVKVMDRLKKNLKAGDILLLHDAHGAITKQGVPVILVVLPQLLKHLQDLNLHAVTLN